MIGGRRGWLAWPLGILSVGVVGGLVWLAAPAAPTVVGFLTTTLSHGSAAAPRETVKTTIADIGTGGVDGDCRALYPQPLWASLVWDRGILLTHTRRPPDTAAPAAAAALHPDVVMTCTWRQMAGTAAVTTTVSRVRADPGVGAAFTARGFTCTPFGGGGVRCRRTADGAREDDVVRGGFWLSTVEHGWHPAHYADEVVEHLWS